MRGLETQIGIRRKNVGAALSGNRAGFVAENVRRTRLFHRSRWGRSEGLRIVLRHRDTCRVRPKESQKDFPDRFPLKRGASLGAAPHVGGHVFELVDGASLTGHRGPFVSAMKSAPPGYPGAGVATASYRQITTDAIGARGESRAQAARTFHDYRNLAMPPPKAALAGTAHT